MTLAQIPAELRLARHRARVPGSGARTLVFAPGFGGEQVVRDPVAQVVRALREVLAA